jgi:hypothetical protein
MPETINNYPTPATTALRVWWNTLTQPRNTAARVALLAHYGVPGSDSGSPPKLIGLSYLLSKFVRARA